MDNSGNSDTGAPTPALTRAVRQLLRPLVGLMLDNGLTYSWLTRILKIIYVEVAEEEFVLPGKVQTDSRISLLTSVHRKDVRRLRSADKLDFEPPTNIFIGAKLVAIWTTDSRFTDKSGAPVAIPRLASSVKKPGDANFEELVAMVSKDIRPRAILDEWLRQGAVSIDPDDNVRLEFDAFVPAKSFEEKAYFLGRNLHDHMAAARQNIRHENPPFLERSAYLDNLSEESIVELEKISREQGAALLKDLYRHGSKLQKKDRKSGKATNRINFGVYFFSDKHD